MSGAKKINEKPQSVNVELGDRVKDKITKFTGIATGKTFWLNGCIRVEVTAEKLQENGEVTQLWLDQSQLTITKKAVIKAPILSKPIEGPRKDPVRRSGG